MDENKIAELRARAENLYRNKQYLCSESLFTVVNDHLGRPVPAEVVRLASGFPVGMGLAGCSCGALTGGIMALGLKYGRTEPGADNAAALAKAKELHDWFHKEFGSTCCKVLIRRFTFGSPEHMKQCIRITGTVTEQVLRMLPQESAADNHAPRRVG